MEPLEGPDDKERALTTQVEKTHGTSYEGYILTIKYHTYAFAYSDFSHPFPSHMWPPNAPSPRPYKHCLIII